MGFFLRSPGRLVPNMEAYTYSLRLRKPLHLPGVDPLTSREGILLHDPETGGWGDAAPLPGFSEESLADVREAILQKNWDANDLPSVRFAVSCSKREFAPPVNDVLCNGLWIPASESVEEVLHRTADWSNLTLKVKPGREPDIDAMKAFAQVRSDVHFRVDGNRQWTIDQTLNIMKELPQGFIEYMEEPLIDCEDYEALWSRAPVPIALDETLLEPGGRELAESENVVAFVLKPTLLGGEEDVAVWNERSHRLNKKLIWSSCFESGVGLWNLARLATGSVPAGLDTGSWFDSDLVNPRAVPAKGMLSAPHTLEISSAFLHSLT